MHQINQLPANRRSNEVLRRLLAQGVYGKALTYDFSVWCSKGLAQEAEGIPLTEYYTTLPSTLDWAIGGRRRRRLDSETISPLSALIFAAPALSLASFRTGGL